MSDADPTGAEPPAGDLGELRTAPAGLALPRKVRHDLRSSIGQVIGYCELWMDEIEETGAVENVEQLRGDLARILEAGRKILGMVNEHIDPIGPRARGE